MKDISLIFDHSAGKNHLDILNKLISGSDECIIAAHHISEEIFDTLGKHVNKITLITTLMAKGEDPYEKLILLEKYMLYFKKWGLKISVQINDELNCNAYIFKYKHYYKGGIISSAGLDPQRLNSTVECGILIDSYELLDQLENNILNLSNCEYLTVDNIKIMREKGIFACHDNPSNGIENIGNQIHEISLFHNEGKYINKLECTTYQALTERIDRYLSGMSPISQRKKIILLKWNFSQDKVPDNLEIALKVGLSKQRVGEILKGEIEIISKYIAHLSAKYQRIFLKSLISNPEPINMSAVGYTSDYPPEFYNGLLSAIFDSVPFKGHLTSTNNIYNYFNSAKRSLLEVQIYTRLKSLDILNKEIDIQDFFNYFPLCNDDYSKLYLLKICLISNMYAFKVSDGMTYICKVKKHE